MKKRSLVKKILTVGLAVMMAVSAMSMNAFAEENATTNNEYPKESFNNADVIDTNILSEKVHKFSSQYLYKTGDSAKTASYTNGGEAMGAGVDLNGNRYEYPWLYDDAHAQSFSSFDLKEGELTVYVNGVKSAYSGKCALCNSVTLVPAEIFDEIGASREYIDEFYMTRITKNETVLEIIPNAVGMRKNQHKGYWIGLRACARYINGRLYLPLRDVAEELNIKVEWDGNTKSVRLSDFHNQVKQHEINMSVFSGNMPDVNSVFEKALLFSAQYRRKDSDHENENIENFCVEKNPDGTEYVIPAYYDDSRAYLNGSLDLNKDKTTLVYVNGIESAYSRKCVIHNSVLLVPVKLFTELGAAENYNNELYITQLIKDNTVLEIIPYFTAMRKNQADGYWVQLSPCARYIDGELYAPLKVIANELNIKCAQDGNAIYLN